jgi:hypothetical protein
MAKQTKPLKPETEISREAYLAKFQDYSNADAQKLGYPNLEVFHLAQRLSYITLSCYVILKMDETRLPSIFIRVKNHYLW